MRWTFTTCILLKLFWLTRKLDEYSYSRMTPWNNLINRLLAIMSPVNSLWFKWKALKLPWRRSWVVGVCYSNHFSISGTVMVFLIRYVWQKAKICPVIPFGSSAMLWTPTDCAESSNTTTRPIMAMWRYLVCTPIHFHLWPKISGRVFGLTTEILAQWHQWLRYVRQEPPSIDEQQRDLLRQAQIKKLAQIADEKWAAKPSFLDKPQTSQPAPATRTSDGTLNSSAGQTSPSGHIETAEGIKQENNPRMKKKGLTTNVPTGPGEKWQPAAWTPPDATRWKVWQSDTVKVSSKRSTSAIRFWVQ